jgi:fatty acid desaturase
MWKNIFAILYTILGYLFGITILISENINLNTIFGIVLTGHTMIFSAYLFHECAHGTISIFGNRSTSLNEYIGKLMLCICGSYVSFSMLQNSHRLHHSQAADTVIFDYHTLLYKYKYLCNLVHVLEWFYIPIVEWILHLEVIISPFYKNSYRKNERFRTLSILIIRVFLFIYLGLGFSIKYFLAWNIMITILRLGDCFQHTFPVKLIDPVTKKQKDIHSHLHVNVNKENDKDIMYDKQKYELENTFSNLFLSFGILNLILHFNFGYHTTHHQKTSIPWFDLPSRYHELDNLKQNTIPMKEVLYRFHKYRTKRILVSNETNENNENIENIGAIGVSFLTDA